MNCTLGGTPSMVKKRSTSKNIHPSRDVDRVDVKRSSLIRVYRGRRAKVPNHKVLYTSCSALRCSLRIELLHKADGCCGNGGHLKIQLRMHKQNLMNIFTCISSKNYTDVKETNARGLKRAICIHLLGNT